MLRFVLFAAFVGFSSAASAVTLTFDGIPANTFVSTYEEAGVSVHAGSREIGGHGMTDSLHLDDSGSPFARALIFSGPHRITVSSFDLIPNSPTEVCERIGNLNCGKPYDNVVVQGVRDGSVIVDERFYMGDAKNTVALGSLFSDLDSFIIRAIRFTNDDPIYYCIDSPCSHFNIDNVAIDKLPPLAPVPLPATAFLIGGAFGLLGATRWRRRSA